MADRLLLDAMKDLKRIDSVVNALIDDKKLQRRFFRNPSRVLIDLGLHPPTTNKAIALSNRIIYATLRNKRLMKLVTDSAQNIAPTHSAAHTFSKGIERGRITAIRPFLQKHQLPVPPMRRLPEDNTREGFFSRAEIESVIKRLPPDLRDFTRWAYFTAWRKGEIASLRWADVDVEGRTVRLSWRRSKNKKARTMTLAGELAAIVERRSAARAALVVKKGLETDRVFFRNDGSPVQDFKKAWATACKAAGVAGRLFHDLRRSGIRNMTRAGVSRKVATAISGHRTEAIYARYDIADEEDLKDAVLKTQAYVETLPKQAAQPAASLAQRSRQRRRRQLL
jgi:integrase